MAIDEQDPTPAGKPWGTVQFTSGAKPYAFRNGELLVSPEGAAALGPYFDIEPIAVDDSVAGLVKVRLPELRRGLNVVRLAALLRARGFTAQPNHVFFADMFAANPGGWNANPGGWNANPGGWNANPGGWNANPGGWNANAGYGGYGGGCCCDDGGSYVSSSRTQRAPTRTYAHPADEPTTPITDMAVLSPCTVVVLDTGLALAKYRDQFQGDASPLRPKVDVDDADESGDGYIDPAAGHGTFIAGIIERLAPKAKVELVRVLATSGDGDDHAITKALDELDKRQQPPQIVSMSFSGYTEDDAPPVGVSGAIAKLQAKGIVVVASAGNDATCRPAWPAALPDVVSVAALGPYGPAPFTNHGPWVRACAPGLEVVSRYFNHAEKNRAKPLPGDTDLDDFQGWATWSGTSFAAPYVAGVLAREIMIRGLYPEDAVARVIDEPSLLRLPGLGTVVNG